MVGKSDHFLAILRIVVDNYLYRIDNGNAAKRGLVEVVTNARLKLTDVYGVVGVGNSRFTNEIKERGGSISAATQTAKGGQTGIVPAVHVIFLHELTEIAL